MKTNNFYIDVTFDYSKIDYTLMLDISDSNEKEMANMVTDDILHIMDIKHRDKIVSCVKSIPNICEGILIDETIAPIPRVAVGDVLFKVSESDPRIIVKATVVPNLNLV